MVSRAAGWDMSPGDSWEEERQDSAIDSNRRESYCSADEKDHNICALSCSFSGRQLENKQTHQLPG